MRNQWAELLSAIGILAPMPNVHHPRAIRLMLHVMQDVIVGMITINKMFRIKDGVFGVGVGGALGGVATGMLLVADRNP